MFPDSFARGIAESFVNDIKTLVNNRNRRFPPKTKICSNDIDIIVIPKFIQEDDETLFGEPFKPIFLTGDCLNFVPGIRPFGKRNAFTRGKRS